MPTVRLPLTAVSIQSAKSTYAYGQPAGPPLKLNAASLMLRTGMPAYLSEDAVVISATVMVNQATAPQTGSVTWNVRRNATGWSTKVTWARKPALTDTNHPLTKTASPGLTWWAFPVTADVQGMIAGSKVNYGWQLTSSSSTSWPVAGATNVTPERHPYLEIEYELPAEAPTGLSPDGGAVSIAKPTLTFQATDGITGIQVQVDPASNPVSPAFDSGTVAASAGVLDLSATSYAGLAAGDTTSWRARSQTALGWGAWSTWATFSRSTLPVLTITAPGSTVADTTPPIQWSVTGTQTAWQARLLDHAGKVLDDSGQVSGTDTDWTPTKGLKASGDQGVAEVRVWDDDVRVASAGAATYAIASQAFTVALSASVGGMDTLQATQTWPSPGVELSGFRAAGIPDEVVIFREDVQVARLNGVDVFDGSSFDWIDWSAPMGGTYTYRVAPAVGGVVSSLGPTATLSPVCAGLWVADPDTDEAAVLWGVDEGTFDRSDLATVHQTIDGGFTRRRLARAPFSGSISGDIVDALEVPATDVLATLDTFAANDAGNVYRLIAGHLNIPVTIGDVSTPPSPLSGSEIVASGKLNFWSA